MTDLFDMLKLEEEQEKRQYTTTANKAVEKMLHAFEWICKQPHGDDDFRSMDEMLLLYENCIPREYCARDITLFSLLLGQRDNTTSMFRWDAGDFLTVLLRNCLDDYVTLDTHGFIDIWGLCYKHSKKHITVNGPGGSFLAMGMAGGLVTVNGNVGGSVGEYMTGGLITINGNAMDEIGRGMRGGIIHLNGKYQVFPGRDIVGGDIYHNGKLVVKDGKRV